MNAASTIDPREATYSPLSLVDDSGRVFFWRGRVLRGVTAAAEAEMRARFECGLVAELARRKLIPRAELTDLHLEGFALVVEHEAMPVVTFPYEWSYGMLRDAAACVLEVNEIANRFGWELKDCHAFNILFDGPSPRYVDLGSPVRRLAGLRGWTAYEEFVRSYDYPLRIWRHGDGFIARRLLAVSDVQPHESFLLYQHPLLRRMGGAALLARWLHAWYGFRNLSGAPEEKIVRRLSSREARFARWLQRLPWLPAQSINLARLRREVLARQRRCLGSQWSSYQAEYPTDKPSARFRRVIDLVREFHPASVLELAGNQGWLSQRLLDEGATGRVVCTDADEEAIDIAYDRAGARGSMVHTAVLDFIFPMATPFGTGPVERLGADLVLALAVSHHILITQHIPVDRFLSSVAAYARRQAFVEFMPLGLWDGHTAPPVPSWYNLDWFRANFARHFRLLREEKLEENRILLIGEVQSQRTD